ncbi:MAG TPA: lysyl oxidase family protein [Candidatus Thermoplasmatota archaeon]|nr:lysyl oxidase family protein [Candidatus Thermoplasmatota archaeon]
MNGRVVALVIGALAAASVSAAAVLMAAGQSEEPKADQDPGPARCADGCPDLVVDEFTLRRDLKQENMSFGAASCAVREGMAPEGDHNYLRFSITTLNIGNADLKLGNPQTQPDFFEFQPCHDHYHFQNYAVFRLWDVSAYLEYRDLRDKNPEATADDILLTNPHLKDGFFAGTKVGFCLRDTSGPRGVMPAGTPRYSDCMVDQGISVGWGDLYDYTVHGQWIMIDGATSGAYYLEVEVNPLRILEESDYTNNALAIRINLA